MKYSLYLFPVNRFDGRLVACSTEITARIPFSFYLHTFPQETNCLPARHEYDCRQACRTGHRLIHHTGFEDRKSTRLNSSHVAISYAVFCLKKKNKTDMTAS